MSNSTSLTDLGTSLAPKKIVKLAFIFEVPLACPFLAYCWYYSDWTSFDYPNFYLILYAISLSFVLFFLNLLFYFTTYKFRFNGMISFIEGVVEPLAESLTPASAILVSIAAGVGEEFFFRGLLLPLSGLFISSVTFALLHFFFEIKKYIVLSGIYTLIGVLFGAIYLQTNSIWVVVIFHALYDFLALIFFRSNFRMRLRSNFQ